MYRFQHFEYLWLLLIVPMIVLVYLLYLSWRSRNIRRLGDYNLVRGQLSGNISGRRTTKFVLLVLALTCAIIGLANLQKGAQSQIANRKGVDVMFALDVSKSMLAKDIAPDRLTRAKQLIQSLMDKMKNDRVGLVIFAGRAYLQSPLTIDYSSAKMLLSTVSPNDVPTQGTVLAQAINLSKESFSQKEKKYKALIVISDGEDHDDEAVKAASDAAGDGIIVHTVGIGSPQGTTITDPATGKVKLDDKGNPVITKLNEAELQDIARAGGGSYQLLGNAGTIANNLEQAVTGMESHNMGSIAFTEYDSYYQYFIFAAFLLLIIDWLIPNTSKIKIQPDNA